MEAHDRKTQKIINYIHFCPPSGMIFEREKSEKTNKGDKWSFEASQNLTKLSELKSKDDKSKY